MKKVVMPSENQYTGDDFQQSGRRGSNREDLLPVPKARREIQNNYFYHYLDFASSLVFSTGDMANMDFLRFLAIFSSFLYILIVMDKINIF